MASKSNPWQNTRSSKEAWTMDLTRSENMRRIRSTGTGPERLLATALETRGLRFDPQGRTPVGRPDLVDADGRLAVFIDGCFWHGCPDHYVRPGSREAPRTAPTPGTGGAP